MSSKSFEFFLQLQNEVSFESMAYPGFSFGGVPILDDLLSIIIQLTTVWIQINKLTVRMISYTLNVVYYMMLLYYYYAGYYIP